MFPDMVPYSKCYVTENLLPVALYSAPIAGSGQGLPVSLVGTVGCSSPSIGKDRQVLKKTSVIKQEYIFCTS